MRTSSATTANPLPASPARGFDGCVQSQKIGLESNVINRLNDLSCGIRRFFDLSDGVPIRIMASVPFGQTLATVRLGFGQWMRCQRFAWLRQTFAPCLRKYQQVHWLDAMHLEPMLGFHWRFARSCVNLLCPNSHVRQTLVQTLDGGIERLFHRFERAGVVAVHFELQVSASNMSEHV